MLNFLYFYICASLRECAVPSMAVFCGFLISLLPQMLLIYFLIDFEIVPVSVKFTGENFFLPFYVRCISVAQSMYFNFFGFFLLLLLLLLLLPEFLTSQLWLGNIHLSLDVVINKIRLGGLICSIKSFLQLNMCQELQIFAVVYTCMYSGAS